MSRETQATEKRLSTSDALMFYGTFLLAGILFSFFIFASLVRLLFWPDVDAVAQLAIYIFLFWATVKWMGYMVKKNAR